MAFNGAGVFVRLYNWVNDAAAAINITAARMDAETQGIADGLSNCITRDGQGKPSAAIDWNAQNLSNVANLSVTTLISAGGNLKAGGGVASNTSKVMSNTPNGTAAGFQALQDGLSSWIWETPASQTYSHWTESGTEKARLDTLGNLTVTAAASTLGYGTGSGGAVTQLTNKATGVTLDKGSGQITMNGAALVNATAVSFTFTNARIAATDVVNFSIASAATAGAYVVQADSMAAGSCRVSVRNVSAGSLSEALVLNFAVLKAVAA